VYNIHILNNKGNYANNRIKWKFNTDFK
jgi:hypothetical protein